MKFKKSLIRQYFLLSLGFGVIMGLIFPVITAFFTDFKRPEYAIIFTVLCIAAGLLVGGFSIIIGKTTILKAIKQIYTHLDKINNENNLQEALDCPYNDEIGKICRYINELLSSFHSFLTDVHTLGKNINESLQNVNASSKEITTTSQQQNSIIKDIVETMEDTGRLSQELDTVVGDVSTISHETETTMNRGFSTVGENLQIMEEIKAANSQTISGIKELGEKIENIWDIVGIINSIAAQTKIIAFNAELEASSAGEAGKNFEIVANEIRRLADNTVISTQQIKEKINEIQESSDSLIQRSRSGNKIIEEGASSTVTLKSVFEQGLASAEQSALFADKVVGMIEKQTGDYKMIFDKLKQLSLGTGQFSDSIHHIAESNQKIHRMAENLQKEFTKYVGE